MTAPKPPDQLILGLANALEHPPRNKSCQQVHIEEVLEDRPEPTGLRQPPSFMHPDLDEMSQGDQLFIHFMGHEPEEVRGAQTISQRLAEAAGEAHSMCFEDIVPKPYQEFKDVFAKESFDELPDQKRWDNAIELALESQEFITKVYPLALVKQKQLDDFLDENLKSQHIHLSKSLVASLVFFIKKDRSLCII